MPSKQAESDQNAQSISLLCSIMASCDDLAINSSKVAPILGIKDAKNVPRKINSIINAYGFEFKAGKVFAKDDNISIKPSTPVKDNGEGGSEQMKMSASHEKAPATPKNSKLPKTPASKKRKLENAGNKEEKEETKDR